MFLPFVYTKMFCKKNPFGYKYKLQWLTSAKDNMHVYIYTKSKNNCRTFLYTKNRHFAKKGQFVLRVYIQKARHFTSCDIYEYFEVGIFIQKAWHFALRDDFKYKKSDTSQKARQFALCFYIQKSWHFALCNFSWSFWN